MATAPTTMRRWFTSRAADTSDLQAYRWRGLCGLRELRRLHPASTLTARPATLPHNNYVIARAQEDGDLGRWRFFMWDAEGVRGVYHDLNWDTFASDLLNGAQASDGHMTRLIYKACLASPEFRLLFADRIEKHFFHGGALTQENIEAEYLALRDDMNPSMAAFRNSASTNRFSITGALRGGISYLPSSPPMVWSRPSRRLPQPARRRGAVRLPARNLPKPVPFTKSIIR
ncbi:MAG: CotH kinase family protein [Verrucomicrobiales bacterium]